MTVKLRIDDEIARTSLRALERSDEPWNRIRERRAQIITNDDVPVGLLLPITGGIKKLGYGQGLGTTEHIESAIRSLREIFSLQQGKGFVGHGTTVGLHRNGIHGICFPKGHLTKHWSMWQAHLPPQVTLMVGKAFDFGVWPSVKLKAVGAQLIQHNPAQELPGVQGLSLNYEAGAVCRELAAYNGPVHMRGKGGLNYMLIPPAALDVLQPVEDIAIETVSTKLFTKDMGEVMELLESGADAVQIEFQKKSLSRQGFHFRQHNNESAPRLAVLPPNSRKAVQEALAAAYPTVQFPAKPMEMSVVRHAHDLKAVLSLEFCTALGDAVRISQKRNGPADLTVKLPDGVIRLSVTTNPKQIEMLSQVPLSGFENAYCQLGIEPGMAQMLLHGEGAIGQHYWENYYTHIKKSLNAISGPITKPESFVVLRGDPDGKGERPMACLSIHPTEGDSRTLGIITAIADLRL